MFVQKYRKVQRVNKLLSMTIQTYNIPMFDIFSALLDIVQLQPVNVTKTSITVQWVWQERSPNTNVLQYRLVLRGVQETNCKSLDAMHSSDLNVTVKTV